MFAWIARHRAIEALNNKDAQHAETVILLHDLFSINFKDTSFSIDGFFLKPRYLSKATISICSNVFSGCCAGADSNGLFQLFGWEVLQKL